MGEMLPGPSGETILKTAFEARNAFMDWRIDEQLLADLYNEYHPVTNIRGFLNHARSSFPEASCGLATVYLMHKLGSGKIIRGNYAGQGHTFLKLSNLTILDITADQFGGPPIYYGQLMLPWSTRPVNSLG